MEGFGGFSFNGIGSAVRKKRSNTSRRPCTDSKPISDYCDMSSLSSTPPSDSGCKVSSDDNTGHGSSYGRKERNLNQCSSKASSMNTFEALTTRKVIKNEDGGFGEFSEAGISGSLSGSNEQSHSRSDSKRCSEGLLGPAWKGRDPHIDGRINKTSISGQLGVVQDGLGNDNKLKKVKLKVGGVTRTIHAKSSSDGASVGGSSSTKPSRSSDAPRPRPKLILQENSDDDHSAPNKGSLRGVPWKDFSRSKMKSDSSTGSILEERQPDQYEPVRKSSRVPKRRIFDDGDDDDEEIRYLEKRKTSKFTSDYGAEDEEETGGKKQMKISKVMKRHGDVSYNVDVGDNGSSRSGKDGRKSKSGRTSEDTDYMGEEETVSDSEDDSKRKNPKMDFVDSFGDSKKDMAVTTRQRALQTGKDVSSSSGQSLIEFPNGLPPAPPRKQKEKLSEVEQQLKKAEAAQRRKMQVEKAARESEAEAIRKILGQDSSRKKREDKIKKRQEELAQEKEANAMIITSDSVRVVMGPTGTFVIFPHEMGLPSIFDAKPCSYPPPREKCAGPSCVKPYKYRDSKSKLPLCSLQCYKAINGKRQRLIAC